MRKYFSGNYVFPSPKSSEDQKKRSSPRFGTKFSRSFWDLFVLKGPFSSNQPALKSRSVPPTIYVLSLGYLVLPNRQQTECTIPTNTQKHCTTSTQTRHPKLRRSRCNQNCVYHPLFSASRCLLTISGVAEDGDTRGGISRRHLL